MIEVMLEHEKKYVTIRFPCTETELATKLNDFDFGFDIHNMWVHAFVEPKEFAPMEQQAHDLDELNYLAKRMDSFADTERRRFFAAVAHEKIYQIPDLINLTFNLNRYTVLQDLSSAYSIGFTYALDEAGCLPAEAITDPKYGTIGKQLLESGTGILTKYGVLFIHADVRPEQVYDGQVFPAYDYHGGSSAEAVISYGGKEETLYLPDEQTAIQKAVRRLGAVDIHDCDVEISAWGTENEQWQQMLQRVVDQESLYAANWLIKQVSEAYPDIETVVAAAEYFKVSSANNLAVLANADNVLGFRKELASPQDVGEYFTKIEEDYSLHSDLEPFFNFEAFGEWLIEDREGAFVNGGFLYYRGADSMHEIEDQLEPETINLEMGGM